jgi:hypothetical protein
LRNYTVVKKNQRKQIKQKKALNKDTYRSQKQGVAKKNFDQSRAHKFKKNKGQKINET